MLKERALETAGNSNSTSMDDWLKETTSYSRSTKRGTKENSNSIKEEELGLGREKQSIDPSQE